MSHLLFAQELSLLTVVNRRPGDKSYYLAGMEDTSMYNCLAPCVYKIEGDDERKMFCFASGILEVACGDGGKFTETLGGE